MEVKKFGENQLALFIGKMTKNVMRISSSRSKKEETTDTVAGWKK